MGSLLRGVDCYREQLRRFASRYRLPIFIAAALGFFTGLYVSFRHIDLDFNTLSYGPFLMVIFITQPLLIILNSFELKLCALASDAKMSLAESVYISNSATIANILPLPAGLVLRGAALIKGGGSLGLVGKVLLVAALMWITIAMMVSGAVIASGFISAIILALGLLAVILLTAYTARLCSFKIASGFLITRVFMVGIMAVQLQLCFAILGHTIGISGAAAYVVSGVAGAVISIVPAGLGIIEGTGALLAKLDGASPAQAYIVLSLNRIIGLGLAAISVVVFGCFQKRYIFGEEV